MASKGIALVTGAARGIGRAIALRLANDGFHVVVNDITASADSLNTLAAEITSKDTGRRASAIVADVSVDGEVKAMVDKVVKDLGGLDVMVANAGVSTMPSTIVDTSVEDWDHVYAVNVRGTFLCYKYAAAQMIAQGRGGRIVGASSIAGKQAGPTLGAYCSSKFAIRGLTQTAAMELGKHRITVNTYAPGPIDTPSLRWFSDFQGKTEMYPQGFLEAMAKRAAVGYIGTPDNVASLVSYIVSKEAHFITGQSITCDGGMVFD